MRRSRTLARNIFLVLTVVVFSVVILVISGIIAPHEKFSDKTEEQTLIDNLRIETISTWDELDKTISSLNDIIYIPDSDDDVQKSELGTYNNVSNTIDKMSDKICKVSYVFYAIDSLLRTCNRICLTKQCICEGDNCLPDCEEKCTQCSEAKSICVKKIFNTIQAKSLNSCLDKCNAESCMYRKCLLSCCDYNVENIIDNNNSTSNVTDLVTPSAEEPFVEIKTPDSLYDDHTLTPEVEEEQTVPSVTPHIYTNITLIRFGFYEKKLPLIEGKCLVTNLTNGLYGYFTTYENAIAQKEQDDNRFCSREWLRLYNKQSNFENCITRHLSAIDNNGWYKGDCKYGLSIALEQCCQDTLSSSFDITPITRLPYPRKANAPGILDLESFNSSIDYTVRRDCSFVEYRYSNNADKIIAQTNNSILKTFFSYAHQNSNLTCSILFENHIQSSSLNDIWYDRDQMECVRENINLEGLHMYNLNVCKNLYLNSFRRCCMDSKYREVVSTDDNYLDISGSFTENPTNNCNENEISVTLLEAHVTSKNITLTGLDDCRKLFNRYYNHYESVSNERRNCIFKNMQRTFGTNSDMIQTSTNACINYLREVSEQCCLNDKVTLYPQLQFRCENNRVEKLMLQLRAILEGQISDCASESQFFKDPFGTDCLADALDVAYRKMSFVFNTPDGTKFMDLSKNNLGWRREIVHNTLFSVCNITTAKQPEYYDKIDILNGEYDFYF
jgi:hypothetical protein